MLSIVLILDYISASSIVFTWFSCSELSQSTEFETLKLKCKKLGLVVGISLSGVLGNRKNQES